MFSWLQLMVVALPPVVLLVLGWLTMSIDGPSARHAICYGAPILAWIVCGTSVTSGIVGDRDSAFEVGKKSLSLVYVSAASIVSLLGLTGVSDNTIGAFHLIVGSAFVLLWLWAEASSPKVSSLIRARHNARQSAVEVQEQASRLASIVERLDSDVRAACQGFARDIQGAVADMGTRSDVDVSSADADIIAAVEALSRRLVAPTASLTIQGVAADLEQCARSVEQLVLERERRISSVA